MQRRVDQRDYRALTDAQRVVGEVFDSAGTDWFPDEQASLHEAIAGIGRVVDSLQKETAIRAIARRIASGSDGRRIVARSIKEMLWRRRRPEEDRDENQQRLDDLRRRDMDEAGLRLKDLRLKNRAPGGMTPEQRAEADRLHPDVPKSIRYLTDWGEVDRLTERARADREHPDVPENIRYVTDWGKVKELVAPGDEGAA